MASPKPIYLDYNATTPPRPEVVEEISRVSRDCFGNPGSRHAAGRAARQVLELSRERLAGLLGALPSEVVFTSGGTESINLALRGLRGSLPGWIISPPGEHPATEQALAVLETLGFQRHVLPIDGEGRIDHDADEDIPWNAARLVTVLLAHNETGVLQDVGELSVRSREHKAPLHLDAVQAVGKIPVNFHALGATALSLGAHKFYGPRGIGALLVKQGTRLPPLLRGGHQELDRRPGTECVALAAGMARALELCEAERAALTPRLISLRERLLQGLAEACPPVQLIGHPVHRLPNTLNVAFPGCDGEAMLVALDLAGVCCSLGSTCSSGAAEPSPILGAMGLPIEIQRSCLRLSLGRETTPEEVDDAVACIASVVRRLRSS